MGRVIPLDLVPDKVFSNRVMGDGLAIVPESGSVKSPFNGTIKSISKSKHIIAISSEGGIDVLIHIGIDSLRINNEDIESLVNEGDKVNQGQEMLKINLDNIKDNVKSIITPVIFTNLKNDEYIYYGFKSIVSRLKPLKIYICKK